MATDANDALFAGSIPELYERWLVPMLFAPYAADLADRVAARSPGRVLELAAGTGVVTRALAERLPADASIVATDLNPPMLHMAASRGTARPVEWRQADALQLPFDAGTFDVVVCQFGVMFFPDKAKAFSEARRVLAPGGTLIFNVWDRIEENDFAHVVTEALETLCPDDPPRFMARIPHGYHDEARIRHDLAAGGFGRPAETTTTPACSRADSAQQVADAYCRGTPLRGEIEARGLQLRQATAVATSALTRRFGDVPAEGRIQAHIVAVER
jgi:SAM-dependent methyltransferase